MSPQIFLYVLIQGETGGQVCKVVSKVPRVEEKASAYLAYGFLGTSTETNVLKIGYFYTILLLNLNAPVKSSRWLV